MTEPVEKKVKFARPSWLHLSLSVLITLVFLYLAFHESESGEFLEIIRGVSLAGVALYALLSVLGVIIRAFRYRLLLKTIVPAEQMPSTYQLILISFVRNTLVDMLPARAGELGYIYFLNRAGVPISSGTSSFGFCIFLDILVLMLIVAGFLLLSFFSSSLGLEQMDTRSIVLTFSLVLAFVVVLFVVLKFLPKLLRLGAATFKKIAARLPVAMLQKAVRIIDENVEHISADFEKLSERGVLLQLCWQTFWLRVLKYSSLYVLLLAVVGQWGLTMKDIHALLSIVAFVVAEASASLPISGLMGFGAYESSWSLVFSLSHVNIPAVLKVGLIVHLITQLKAYSCGFLAMLLLLLKEFPRSYSTDAPR